MDTNEVVYSEHCHTVTRRGISIDVKIFRTRNGAWVLKTIDEDGYSILWDFPFETDDQAFLAFNRILVNEGIYSLVHRYREVENLSFLPRNYWPYW